MSPAIELPEQGCHLADGANATHLQNQPERRAKISQSETGALLRYWPGKTGFILPW
jgi:hypothetical protein